MNVNVNVNVNGRAARNGRNEDQENEKQFTVTAAPLGGINFWLQLQSCLRGELIRCYSYRRVLSGIQYVIFIARMVVVVAVMTVAGVAVVVVASCCASC